MYTSLRHGYTFDILWLGRIPMFLEHPTGGGRPTDTRVAMPCLCLPNHLWPATLLEYFMVRMLFFDFRHVRASPWPSGR